MTIRYGWDSREWCVPIGVRFGKVIAGPKSSWNIHAKYQTSLVYDDYLSAAVDNSFRVNVSYTMPGF